MASQITIKVAPRIANDRKGRTVKVLAWIREHQTGLAATFTAIAVLVAVLALARDFFDWTWRQSQPDAKQATVLPAHSGSVPQPSASPPYLMPPSARIVAPNVKSASPSLGLESTGELHVNLSFETADRGRVGVDEYLAPRRFGFESKVYDDNGELDTGCNIRWKLFDSDGKVIFTHRGDCSDGVLVNDPLLGPGKYKFVGNIETESGKRAIESKSFRVVER